MNWPCLLQHLPEDRGRVHCADPQRCARALNWHPINATKAPPSREIRSPVPEVLPLTLGGGPAWSKAIDLVVSFISSAAFLVFQADSLRSGDERLRIPQKLGVEEPRGCAALPPLARQSRPLLPPPPLLGLEPTGRLWEKCPQSGLNCALWTGFWVCWGSVARPAVCPQVPRREGKVS